MLAVVILQNALLIALLFRWITARLFINEPEDEAT
jgi:hypothetical protein